MKKNIDSERIWKSQRKFAKERDWEQFHHPKNLAAALSVEASELLEIFQWMEDSESRKFNKNHPAFRNAAREMADIFYHLMRLADLMGVDLEKEFLNKMKENRKKYPARLAKGNAKKYTELKTRTPK